MISINYRDARPIYTQVKDGLRKLILTGALAPGTKLPSVRELAAELAINPNPIQRAYRELEAEGTILSIAGKGSIAAEQPQADAAALQSAIEGFRQAAERLAAAGMQKSAMHALLDEWDQQKAGRMETGEKE